MATVLRKAVTIFERLYLALKLGRGSYGGFGDAADRARNLHKDSVCPVYWVLRLTPG